MCRPLWLFVIQALETDLLTMPFAPLLELIDLLLVDDEPDFLEPACRFFQRQGYRVSAAANAEQAISVQSSQQDHGVRSDGPAGKLPAALSQDLSIPTSQRPC